MNIINARNYWESQYGRSIADVEMLEIEANLCALGELIMREVDNETEFH